MTDPPRVRNAEATRDALLHAAMRRFTVLGYEHTTTRDVAADAGVNVALIARYFGSKDGLFAAVMGEFAQTMADYRAGRTTSMVGTMLEQLDAGAWPEFGREHPLLLLLRDIGGDERVGELRRRTLEEVLATLADELGPGRSEDAALRAELVLALYAGVLTLRAALPGGELAGSDPDRVRAALARAVAAVGASLDRPPDP